METNNIRRMIVLRSESSELNQRVGDRIKGTEDVESCGSTKGIRVKLIKRNPKNLSQI